MKNKKLSKAGFTLLEILIAVMIIGVLTTVALPMYRGAIDKSRWSKMIAPAKAVATAQEVAYMNQGGYTANIEDLDVSLPEGGDMTYTLYTTTNGDDANFIRIASSNLDNVRLARYYKKNEGFEDQLYCEAKLGEERANKLCGKLLHGEELVNTNDGYKMYLLKDKITKPLCDKVELWWSNNFTHCYKTEEERCTANTMPYGGGLCGWTDTKNQTVNEGGKCEGTIKDGCNGSIINDGGKCEGGRFNCQNSTINEGGVCESTGYAGCNGSIINNGGVCLVTDENQAGCGGVTINEGGECIAQAGTGAYYSTCSNAKIYSGGKCTAESGSHNACMSASIYDGGVCDGGSSYSCEGAKVYEGGVCKGNALEACKNSNFYTGAICEGNATGACRISPSYRDDGFFEGSVCNGNVNKSCAASFHSGSVCNGYANGSCGGGIYVSEPAVFGAGSICNGYVAGSCGKTPDNNSKAIFQEGSRCVAHVAGACDGTYQEGSCCQGGDNCPEGAPRC